MQNSTITGTDDGKVHKLLPSQVGEIPKLDHNGFNISGTLKFIPKIGDNFIDIYYYPIPWDYTRRIHMGDIKLEH